MSASRPWGWALCGMVAACGGTTSGPGDDCSRPADPGPMSSARARQLAPEVVTGLAVSTTHLVGDCRPRAADPVGVTPECGDGHCLRTRAPLRVLLLAANVSVAVDPRCDGGAPVADLETTAAADAAASELGELVVALDPGIYRPFLVRGDGCAVCGDPGAGACTIRVDDAAIAVRDLVLDEAAH